MKHVLTYSYREQQFKPHNLDCSCQFHAELANMETANWWAMTHENVHKRENDFSMERVGFPVAPVVEPVVEPEAEEEVEHG